MTGSTVILALALTAGQDQGVVTLPVPPGATPSDTTRVQWRLSAEASAAGRSGLMWKTVSDTTTVYLVGSVHFGTEDMYPLPAHIENAFRNSSVLVVEVDPYHATASDLEGIVPQPEKLPPGDTLWNHVKPGTRDLVRRFCRRHGYDPESLTPMTVHHAAGLMWGALTHSAGLDSELGIDRYFIRQARGTKRLVELETVGLQLRLHAGWTADEDERMLADVAGNFDRYGEMVRSMTSVWMRGDVAAVDAMVSSMLRISPEARQRFFRDRNPRMIEAVERFLGGGEPCFVVVGAGHMLGSDGIVNALRQKGFRVEQVFEN